MQVALSALLQSSAGLNSERLSSQRGDVKTGCELGVREHGSLRHWTICDQAGAPDFRVLTKRKQSHLKGRGQQGSHFIKLGVLQGPHDKAWAGEHLES